MKPPLPSRLSADLGKFDERIELPGASELVEVPMREEQQRREALCGRRRESNWSSNAGYTFESRGETIRRFSRCRERTEPNNAT